MSKRTVRVLLLEDNPGDVELVRDALAQAQEEEYVLSHAWRLAEAIEKLQAQTFDVVLTDLLVPDSMGLVTMTKLHQAAPGLPILVCAAISDEEMGADAVRKGAQGCLVKGRFTGQQICRAILEAIERNAAAKPPDDPNAPDNQPGGAS